MKSVGLTLDPLIRTRIGYFGGSFDPPHLGHLAVARRAADAFDLESVLLAPTGNQPFKPDGAEASFRDRKAMTALLCEEEQRLRASDVDGPQPDGEMNYTIEALRRLRGHIAAEDVIFAVVGADAFAEFDRWRSPEALLRAAEWIVVSRPGVELAALPRGLREAAAGRIHRIDDVREPASATALRERLREGDSCEDWLPPRVFGYIREHHLYGT